MAGSNSEQQDLEEIRLEHIIELLIDRGRVRRTQNNTGQTARGGALDEDAHRADAIRLEAAAVGISPVLQPEHRRHAALLSKRAHDCGVAILQERL